MLILDTEETEWCFERYCFSKLTMLIIWLRMMCQQRCVSIKAVWPFIAHPLFKWQPDHTLACRRRWVVLWAVSCIVLLFPPPHLPHYGQVALLQHLITLLTLDLCCCMTLRPVLHAQAKKKRKEDAANAKIMEAEKRIKVSLEKAHPSWLFFLYLPWLSKVLGFP